jgi:putative redox protein
MQLSLDWLGGLKFASSFGNPAIELHSSTPGVASPPEALAYAAMACMAMDLVHTIEKARHSLDRLVVRFAGERAATHPRHFVRMSIHFDITGSVAPSTVERAIDLSRRTYCSVWHTIRPDVALTTTYAIHPPPMASA